MGWKGGQTTIRHNEDIRELLEKKIEHLKENYEGPTDFYRQALEKEETLSTEEKLKEIREEKQELRQKEKQLEQVIQDREQQQEYKDKKELLKQKQDRLNDLLSQDLMSRSEAEEKVLNQFRERSTFAGMSEDEIKDTRAFGKRVEKLHTSESDLESLRNEVERLQREVAELNGGRENWFIELDEMEVSA